MTESPKPSVRSAIRPSQSLSPIDATTAVVAFGATLIAAWVLSLVALTVFGEDGGSDTPIGAIAAVLIVSWFAYVAGMWIVSDRSGSADPVDDFGIRFVPVDLIGLGIGVLAQLVLVRLVYVPLEGLWPATFTDEALKRNAEGLVDRAGGVGMVALFVLVVLGAPIFEELFYRGLLQRSLLARYNDVFVVVGVAAVFTLVHFRPVEYPGLFVLGLIVGTAAMLTGRLGMSIAIHVGFNLAGLLLVM